MANEIDLFNDLQSIERLIKGSKTNERKEFWTNEKNKLIEEIKDQYPDLILGAN